jgi:hypothetical protein
VPSDDPLVSVPEVRGEGKVNLIRGLGWLLAGVALAFLAINAGLLLMGGIAELVHNWIKS